MNTIVIQLEDGAIVTAPIMDDIAIEAVSEFQSIGDLVPTADSIVTLLTATGAGTNSTSQTAVLARSILDAPRWTKTNPVKITIDLHFYTETDSKKDVVDKMNILLGLHVLSIDTMGVLKIPGFNAKNIKDVKETLTKTDKNKSVGISIPKKATTKDVSSAQTKNISVLIPGIVYLPLAFIYAITPTYSKFKTSKGLPLWATASLQIVSLTPASIQNFEDGNLMSYSSVFGIVNDNAILNNGVLT